MDSRPVLYAHNIPPRELRTLLVLLDTILRSLQSTVVKFWSLIRPFREHWFVAARLKDELQDLESALLELRQVQDSLGVLLETKTREVY
jgi:hypothetical protein